MQITLSAPKAIRCQVDLPASKSISNRALLLNALSGNGELPQNLSDCDDTQVMLAALSVTGAVNTASDPAIRTIDIKAAGTAMRFLTAYRSITPGTVVITGTQRMRQRPIRILVDALRTLGADIRYTEQEGFPPLRITGKTLGGGTSADGSLVGGTSGNEAYEDGALGSKALANESPSRNEITLQGDVSSQYISALLMIAPTLPAGLTLHLRGEVVSRPYIDLTLQLMRDFGAEARWADAHTIQVPHGTYRPTTYYVESDWSAASYWYQIVALAPEAEVRLKGLFAHSCQGDSVVADLFGKLGVRTTFDGEGVTLTKCPSLYNNPDGNGSFGEGKERVSLTKLASLHNSPDGNGFSEEGKGEGKEGVTQAGESVSSGDRPCGLLRFDYDFVNQPDLAQTFVVTCALMGLPFRFTGLQSLKIKETDRIAALRRELRKLGYLIREADDSILYWDGERCQPQPDPAIDTYEDHRMAMAFAPASLVMPTLRVNDPQVVSKSYPTYWTHLRAAGFTVRETTDGQATGEGESL